MTKPLNLSPARKRWLVFLIGLTLVLLAGIGWNAQQRLNALTRPGTATSQPGSSDIAIQEIPLTGPISKADAEISGMAWYGDWLVLLPQYPGRMGGQVYVLSKDEIIAFLDGEALSALAPQPVTLVSDDLETSIPGFEGFEAISFLGTEVFLTVEANQSGKMLGYIVRGTVQPGEPPASMNLESNSLQAIEPQAALSNYSDESMVVFQGQIYTIYEANGANVNPSPQAHRFQSDLSSAGTLAFPTIEYRITDATPADATGRFWAINYLFPGDLGKLRPAADGLNPTPDNQPAGPVERLVAFQVTGEGILIDQTQPVLNLELLPDGEARNWEAIARLDGRGFLLATDKFPGTILGFVAVGLP